MPLTRSWRQAASRSANIDLQDQLASFRDKVAASSRDLAAAQAQVAALTEEMRAKLQQDVRQATATDQTATAKGDKVTQLSTALHQAEAQRATLAARLSKAEADLADQQARQNELLGQIDQWQKRLEQLSSDRDKLKARVTDLEKQSALRHATQPVAAAQPAPAPAAPAQTQTPPARGRRGAQRASVRPPHPSNRRLRSCVPPRRSDTARSISSPACSLPPGSMSGTSLPEFGVNQARAARSSRCTDSRPQPTLSPEKLAALRAMIKTLPVTAPLAEFEISSPFGVRGDPENGASRFPYRRRLDGAVRTRRSMRRRRAS